MVYLTEMKRTLRKTSLGQNSITLQFHPQMLSVVKGRPNGNLFKTEGHLCYSFVFLVPCPQSL